jgi:hypothetical protein
VYMAILLKLPMPTGSATTHKRRQTRGCQVICRAGIFGDRVLSGRFGRTGPELYYEELLSSLQTGTPLILLCHIRLDVYVRFTERAMTLDCPELSEPRLCRDAAAPPVVGGSVSVRIHNTYQRRRYAEM